MNIQMPVDFGKHLYHFTQAETALLYILPSLQLKLSSPLHTNDPQENKTFGSWHVFDEFDSFGEIPVKKDFNSFLKDSCRILCFSEDYEIHEGSVWYTEGFKHPTMWAHYADRFKGVCLVFYKEILLKNLHNKDCVTEKVNYQPYLPFPAVSKEKYEHEGKEYISKYFREHASELFFTKYIHWAPEDEYRILCFDGSRHINIRDSLAGIYYGYDINQNLLSLLRKYAQDLGCWLEQVSLYSGLFQATPDEQIFRDNA